MDQVDAKKQGILLLPLTVHSLFLSPAIFSRLCDFRPTFELPWTWWLRFPPLWNTSKSHKNNTLQTQFLLRMKLKVEKMIELVYLEHLHSGKLLETRSFRMWLQNLIEPVGAIVHKLKPPWRGPKPGPRRHPQRLSKCGVFKCVDAMFPF